MKELFDNLTNEILHLSNLYHGLACHSEKTKNDTLLPPSEQISFVYRLDTKPHLLYELSELSKTSDTGPLIPTPSQVAQKVEEINKIPFRNEDMYRFRITYLVTQLHNQVSNQLHNQVSNQLHNQVSKLVSTKKMDGIKLVDEESLRLQHQMDKERIKRCGLHIRYLENVVFQLSQKATIQRSHYFKELDELKRESREMMNGTVGEMCSEMEGRKGHRLTSVLEMNESVLTPVEEKVHRALLLNEQIKTEQLAKWVENLKIQLRIERMRVQEKEIIPAFGTGSGSGGKKTLDEDSTYKSEDQAYINELLEQIKLLSNQVKLTEMPKPTIVVEKDIKWEIKAETLEKQVDMLQQKIGDLSRENMMLDSRNRALQKKYDDLEKRSLEKTELQSHTIKLLQNELDANELGKQEKVLTVQKEVSKEKKIENQSLDKAKFEGGKKIAELVAQNGLLETRVTEQQNQIELLKARIADEVKKGEKVLVELKMAHSHAQDIKQGIILQEGDPKVQSRPSHSKENANQQGLETRKVKVKQAWEKDKNIVKSVTRPKTKVNPVGKKEKKGLSKITIKYENSNNAKEQNESALVQSIIIEMEPSVPRFERPERAFKNKKPPIRSKSLNDLSRGQDSVGKAMMKRVKSLPLLIPKISNKRDKAFRMWLKEYGFEREKILERVSRRWARLSKQMLDRVERRKQNAQQKGSKYFTMAISQLTPISNLQNTAKQTRRNVFHRLQTLSFRTGNESKSGKRV